MNKQSVIKFKIKSRISDKHFWVYIYPTLKAMRADAKEHDAKSSLKQPSIQDAIGVTHVYVRERVYATGRVRQKKEIGIIRLVKTRLTTEVVAHEVVHAAMWNYRLEFGIEHEWEGSVENACFGNSNGPMEESFAYIYGQMFREITIKLYNKKFWNSQ